MADDPKLNEPNPAEDGYLKPDPSKNPRNQAVAEIAARVALRHAEDAKETMPSIDEDGKITPAPAAPPPEEPTPPAQEVKAEPPPAPSQEPPPAAAAPVEPKPEPIDPEKMYKVKIDGQEVEVPGQKIIDAGFRTFQKETAADFRLKIASELLREAQEKAKGATPQGAQPGDQPPKEEPKELSDAELARQLQIGSEEQAAAAVKILRSRGVATPEQIAGFVAQQSRLAARDEFLFQDALSFVKTEYSDLFANDYITRLFFGEENRRRHEGNQKPYRELYKEIGDDLRKAFNMPKAAAKPAEPPSTPAKEPPAGSPEARAAAKAKLPPVPKTAASRISEQEAAGKVKTPTEIIAEMAAKRGQNRLTPLRKE